MEVDPLAAIITWLKTALTTVNQRVAAKHKYGDGWTDEQAGVAVHMDGGPVDLYAKVAMPRLEIRIYAKDDQEDVVAIWQELVGLSRDQARFTVNLSGGKIALVQYFLPASSLSLLYDDVLRMEMGVVFFDALVSEENLA